jgi:hypothetical protein
MQRVGLAEIRGRLAKIWFYGMSVPYVLLVIQSGLDHFGGELQQAWAWLIPNTVPTLALMIGVIGAGAFAPDDERTVQKGFAELTTALCLGYLGLILLTIGLEAFGNKKGATFLSLSNYWLAPAQGVVVAALGFLFSSASQKTEKPPDKTP